MKRKTGSIPRKENIQGNGVKDHHSAGKLTTATKLPS